MLPWSVVDLLIQRHALRKQQHHHRVEQRLHRVRVAPLILASISAVLPYSFFSPTNHQSALVEQQLHHLRVALAACYSPASARCVAVRVLLFDRRATVKQLLHPLRVAGLACCLKWAHRALEGMSGACLLAIADRARSAPKHFEHFCL